MNEMASSLNVYSFWDLLNEFKIVIPIIQRDYAQGRNSKKVKPIRDDLLETIYSALIDEKKLDFDFVYGSVKDKILYPLDGQQRLTTLFLLHWYIAAKEGKLNDVRASLHNFTYETRISTREFCKRLVEMNYSPTTDIMPSDYIRNQNCFFDIWNNDPTISAMLTMLDDIHQKFCCEKKILLPLLLNREKPIITFNFLPMENYALTDDLYIKMNSRGKNLSDFENFKAKFLQHLKSNGLPYEHFERSIDSTWTDLLWDYRIEPVYTIDQQFMYLFTFITEMLNLETSTQKDGNSPFEVNDIRSLISFYDSKEKVLELYELMDLWKNKSEIDTFFDNTLSDTYEEGKVRIFENNHNLFTSVIQKNSLTEYNKVILFSIMKRKLYFQKNGIDDKDEKNFIRIVRNFVIKVRQRKNETFSSDFRYYRHGAPYIRFVEDNLLSSNNIYHTLLTVSDDPINSESLKSEKEKAQFICLAPDAIPLIHHLEDMDCFRGSIQNMMPYIMNNPTFYDLPLEIDKLFTEDYYEDLFRALLSICDYGIRFPGSYYGDRYYYGTRKNWYTILSLNDDRYPKLFNDFFSQYFSTDSTEIDESLNEIISNNIRNVSINDWRYYFLKYPYILENHEYVNSSINVLLLEESAESETVFYIPHRLNGRKLSGYHICALYLEVKRQLSSLDIQINCGKDSDSLGSIEYNSIQIELSPDGSILLDSVIDDLRLDEIITNSIEKYSECDVEHLDYIEKMVLMIKILSECNLQ